MKTPKSKTEDNQNSKSMGATLDEDVVEGENPSAPFQAEKDKAFDNFVKKILIFVKKEPSVTRCGVTEKFIIKLAKEFKIGEGKYE